MPEWFDRTSLIATPCLSALSWSTLMYCSGTLGMKVELIMPISGRLASGYQELASKLSERNFHILSGAVLQNELKSTGGADAGYRRRREAENSPFGKTTKFLIQSSFYFLDTGPLCCCRIAPGFQRNEEETVVAGVGEAEQIESDNGRRVLNSRNVCQNVLYLFPSLAGAFHRRRDGKLHAFT